VSDTAEPPKRKTRKIVTQAAESAPAESATAEPIDGAGSDARSWLKFSDPLVAPFAICMISGIGLEFLERVPGLQTVGLFGPILATLAYPVWGFLSGVYKRSSLRERLADNSYYLGFIFTQVSLLVGFGVPALTREQITSNDVLQFFGVAIGASMIGLIARTILVQTGHTVTENADIVQDEVEILSQEVEQLARGVSSSTRRILDDLNDISAALAKSRQQMSENVAGWTGTITNSFSEYGKLVDSQSAAMGRSVQTIDTATLRLDGGLSASGNALITSIRQAAAAVDQLQGRLDQRLTEAGEMMLANTRSLVEAADTVRNAGGSANAALAQTVEGIRETSRLVSQGASAMRALDTLQGRLGSIDAMVTETADASKATVQGARLHTQTLKDELAEVTDALQQVLKGFRDELEQVRA